MTPGARTCACGCRASLAHKRPQARYLSDRHRKRDHMRRLRGAPHPLTAHVCVCGEAVLHDASKPGARRRFHPECADRVRGVMKNRHKRTSDLARSMGWTPPRDGD